MGISYDTHEIYAGPDGMIYFNSEIAGPGGSNSPWMEGLNCFPCLRGLIPMACDLAVLEAGTSRLENFDEITLS